MGLETADKGEFEVGETVKVAYVDQQHKDIDPNKSVYQVISGGNDLIRMGGRDINARAYLSRFNFSGADQEKLCGVLSGGERNRLHLALCLKEEGNVLLLDEPTNDIDVNTLRALEEGLGGLCRMCCGHQSRPLVPSTVSVRIFSLLKETPMCSSLKVPIRSTKKIN